MSSGLIPKSPSMDSNISIPSSTNPAWLHAERTAIKVVESGNKPYLSIWEKRKMASWPCPFKAKPIIIVVQDWRSLSLIPSNTW
ncbi:hypothetical protein IEQ34_015675 [Dendrobium chrysotoxum]|uniref:Uncharacterized protein n=1 Tax=Dendrobium chrysotoxum TaxID=161865 RepID=A0AAV7GJL3_DENCH|nr:hypothetical protein IEQ34_015675 [Dendrobium chrysotoxum]